MKISDKFRIFSQKNSLGKLLGFKREKNSQILYVIDKEKIFHKLA